MKSYTLLTLMVLYNSNGALDIKNISSFFPITYSYNLKTKKWSQMTHVENLSQKILSSVINMMSSFFVVLYSLSNLKYFPSANSHFSPWFEYNYLLNTIYLEIAPVIIWWITHHSKTKLQHYSASPSCSNHYIFSKSL